MKLYYAPGACSLAPHIALEELGLSYQAIPVDLQAKTIAGGGDYRKINPKGAVPALELDDGEVLTENAVILQYLADKKPQAGLMPQSGMEKWRTLEWLNFIATELHKGFGPLWMPQSSEEAKHLAKEMLMKKFEVVARQLRGRNYLMGDHLTLPDIYLSVILGWANYHKLDLSRFPELLGFAERMKSRPAVLKTLKAEGLVK